MRCLKKTLVAVLALGTSTFGFAGSMGPVCATGTVITIPCPNTVWNLGIQALYLNPDYSTAFTQSISSTPAPSSPIQFFQNLADSGVYNNDNNHWNWGLKLEASYHFNRGNDLNLNWYHFNDLAIKTLIQGSGLTSSITDNLNLNQFFSNVDSSLKTQWDAVNLEIGQDANFSEVTHAHLYGGFQYAYIKSTNTNSATSDSTASLVNRLVHFTHSGTTMQYSGIGPRVGIDLSYNLNKAFSLYAKAASALLIGSQQFNGYANGLFTPYAVGEGFIDRIRPYTFEINGSSTTIVPELELKAGTTYSFFMAQSSLIIDGGWMWANYFNALKGNGFRAETKIDFGIQGAYLGMKWIGNFA